MGIQNSNMRGNENVPLSCDNIGSFKKAHLFRGYFSTMLNVSRFLFKQQQPVRL